LEVSVHVSGYPPLFQGEWELRLNDIGGAKSLACIAHKSLEICARRRLWQQDSPASPKSRRLILQLLTSSFDRLFKSFLTRNEFVALAFA